MNERGGIMSQDNSSANNSSSNSNNIVVNVVTPGVATVQKSRWVAFFLCFFLGYIGAHRFYVGKVGTGLLYLFTGGFLCVGILIDLILILTGSFRDQSGSMLI